jgi:hypothetical protein
MENRSDPKPKTPPETGKLKGGMALEMPKRLQWENQRINWEKTVPDCR